MQNLSRSGRVLGLPTGFQFDLGQWTGMVMAKYLFCVNFGVIFGLFVLVENPTTTKF